MQHSRKIEPIDFSALINVPPAERRWAAAVPESGASRLDFAVLAESMKQKRFCIVEGIV